LKISVGSWMRENWELPRLYSSPNATVAIAIGR
jgi:hypothetical protein